MIKAEELRIGNWVKDIEPYEYIFQVDYDHIVKAAVSGYEYRPVRITDEWLFRLGFQIENQTGTGFSRWQLGKVVLIDGCDMDTKHRIEYVHQLQNYYHAKTGVELMMKEYA